MPEEFGLEQNYPNPFNPTTVIRYDLPVDAHVELKVYNMLGQEVATLVDETQSAGFKSVVWDASRMGSGVYYFMVTAGSFSAVRKMILVK
jgi:flagellar hook assembly protein FlgD